MSILKELAGELPDILSEAVADDTQLRVIATIPMGATVSVELSNGSTKTVRADEPAWLISRIHLRYSSQVTLYLAGTDGSLRLNSASYGVTFVEVDGRQVYPEPT